LLADERDGCGYGLLLKLKRGERAALLGERVGDVTELVAPVAGRGQPSDRFILAFGGKADQAAKHGEIPLGAFVVLDGFGGEAGCVDVDRA